MNSETPEVDAEVKRIEADERRYEDRHDCYCALIDFARRLELRCKRLEEALRAIHIRTFGGASLRFNHKQIEEVCRKALADQKEEKS